MQENKELKVSIFCKKQNLKSKMKNSEEKETAMSLSLGAIVWNESNFERI